MGVAGCGKSTVGLALAKSLNVPFFDGDDYHPPANVEKMRTGQPLDDADRAGWLAQLADLLGAHAEAGCIVACSALKAKYRDQLGLRARPIFVHLLIQPAAAERRLRARPGHFMPASLIKSQFETLEPPTDAITVDAGAPIDQILRTILEQLRG